MITNEQKQFVKIASPYSILFYKISRKFFYGLDMIQAKQKLPLQKTKLYEMSI